ncbi:NAD-dependent epimerase/dehydratase family protein [Devosia sp. PTR5]|uniref:NAD-dependent epimerase/dehydratase family protein n=1 Tax=Devosia oryzisoli TaxID=2774138 RepID=A0A927FXM5_9HYPH|nr:NAD-dependent epimerase/dehydratase family protein [Devosia oryzisoli]MBD8066803.1 NAD-dependent epimerase/dehydratase family protein [Devosia oryzisoli]
MRVFVTGTSGFIGFHLAQRLLADGHAVLGYDGMTAYYDVALKQARRELLMQSGAFSSAEAMLEDKAALDDALGTFGADVIVHLAAQAGVRYSLEAPEAYVSANLVGTFNLLEGARAYPPRHLLLASTSSVYGGNRRLPFSEADRTDFPVSLYAATKKATEEMSHAYAHLHDIPTTCFRFFTVYGPWGRPDMALFKFVDAIERGQPIDVYGHGQMRRDLTDVSDLVEAIVRLMDAVPRTGQPVEAEGVTDSLSPVAPWRSVNIAGGQPIGLLPFIEAVERATGKTAIRNMLPMQPADVVETTANPALLQALTGFVPNMDVDACVSNFVAWYRQWTGHHPAP